MPIEMYWDDEDKTILRGDLIGTWTWMDYHQNTQKAEGMAVGLTHRIDHIVDMSRSDALPEGSPLSHFRRARETDFINPGIVVIVGADYLLKMFVEILEKALGRRFPPRHLVDTIEEAYQIIADSRKEGESKS